VTPSREKSDAEMKRPFLATEVAQFEVTSARAYCTTVNSWNGIDGVDQQHGILHFHDPVCHAVGHCWIERKWSYGTGSRQ
jgi:hypothetical protein